MASTPERVSRALPMVRLLINTFLLRPCLPLFMETADLGTLKRSAINCMTALLAMLSTGGEVTQTLSESPCMPAILFFDA